MVKDYSTYAGCCELAHKIRSFWALRGKRPDVTVQKRYLSSCKTDEMRPWYYVHSDMVNGWPR